MWKQTAVAIVARKNQTIRHVPRFSSTDWPEASGLSLGKTKDMMVAGIKKFTAAGMKRVKNAVKFRTPFCHTMSVVMSPKGLKAPPALDATTILMQAGPIKRGLLPPMAMTTAHIKSAVVKLSAIGEIKKGRIPVSQKSDRSPRDEAISFFRNHSNRLRSSIAFMYVIATKRKSINSENSGRFLRTTASANCS